MGMGKLQFDLLTSWKWRLTNKGPKFLRSKQGSNREICFLIRGFWCCALAEKKTKNTNFFFGKWKAVFFRATGIKEGGVGGFKVTAICIL